MSSPAGPVGERVPGAAAAALEAEFLLFPGDGLLLVADGGIVEHLDRAARRRLGAAAVSWPGSPLGTRWPELAELLAVEAARLGEGPCDRELAYSGTTITVRLFRTDTGVGIGLLEPSSRTAGTPLQTLLASLLHAVNDAVIVTTAEPVDAPGPVIVWANPAARRQTGHSLGAMLGRSPRMFQGTATLAEDRSAFRRAIQTWQPLTHEIDNLRADGAPIRVEISITPLADSGGWFTHWVSVQRDVTAVRQAARCLQESEEHFRLLAENVSDVVVRLADDGTVLWVSPSLCTRLGWRSEDWVGRPALSLMADPRDLAGHRADLEALRKGRTVVLRHRVRDREGEVHWLETHASPYRHADGRRDGVVASSRLVDVEVAAERELERRARTDDLTGLLNRREILERLELLASHPPRRGGSTAVMFCDLDQFKGVNDRLGHLTGDAVLRSVARRLRRGLRSSDLAARVGGDELMVVLPGVQDLDNAVAVAENLRRLLEQPVLTDRGDVIVTASIGVTLLKMGENIDALIGRADEAMYRAKNHGRNRVIPIPLPNA